MGAKRVRNQMSDINLLAENENLGGFREFLGFRVLEWEPGRVQASIPVAEHLLNRNGFVHGGVLTTLLDSAAGLSGTYCALPGNIRRCSTISLNTQFMSPAQEGVLRAEGVMLKRGSKIFFAEARVTLGDVLVATAQGSFRYVLGGDDENGVFAR